MTGQLFSTECERIREYVSASLDGELSEVERMALDAHVGSCADCRVYAASTAHVTDALRNAPLDELGFAIVLPNHRLAVAHKLQVAAAAAALAVTVGLSVVVGNLGPSHASSAGSGQAASSDTSALRSPEAELKLLHQASEARSRLVIHSRQVL